MSLQEKVIIVTGGTSGIGEACSRHFAGLGARVVIASNQDERGRALESELRAAGRDVRFVPVDVANEESVQAMVRRAVEHYGRIDGVHCNAGVWARGKVGCGFAVSAGFTSAGFTSAGFTSAGFGVS